MRHCILKIVLTSLCFASSFVTAQVNSDIDDYWLGSTRGPYTTGTMIETWVDESRNELSTSVSDDKRHVAVQLWYPSEQDDNAEFAPYATHIDQYAQYIQDWGKDLAERPTRSVLNATLDNSQETYPVIIYNHGGGTPVFTGTAQSEFLASHGFVVVSVEHTNYSGRIKYPDGIEYTQDITPGEPPEDESDDWSQLDDYHWFSEQQQPLYSWYVDDISFVLDKLESLEADKDSIFFQRLDTENTGVMGFSIGGATSFQAAMDDDRIKAAVNLDGTVGGRPVEKLGSTKPILFLESTADRFTPMKDTAVNPSDEEITAYIEFAHWGMFRRTKADWYRARLMGVQHFHFSDIIIGNENAENGLMDYKKAHGIINDIVLEFFNKYLYEKTETPLLSREISYPELRLITRLEQK